MLFSESKDFNPELIQALQTAAHNQWTGILRCFNESHDLGLVVFFLGKVAWAAAIGQTNNFGSLLEEFAKIPKERQKEIFQTLRELGQTKEFSRQLEESGIIERPVLRECLKRHIKSALASLLISNDLTTKKEESNLADPADLSFGLDEVLDESFLHLEGYPQSVSDTPDISAPENEGIKTSLEKLENLTGYQYSFVCDGQGTMLESHRSESIDESKINTLLRPYLNWIQLLAGGLGESNSAGFKSFILELDDGLLVAHRSTGERKLFVTGFFDETGKPGVITHKVREISQSLFQ